jgi:hypothetical protein
VTWRNLLLFIELYEECKNHLKHAKSNGQKPQFSHGNPRQKINSKSQDRKTHKKKVSTYEKYNPVKIRQQTAVDLKKIEPIVRVNRLTISHPLFLETRAPSPNDWGQEQADSADDNSPAAKPGTATSAP